MKNTFVALGLLALQACNTGTKVDNAVQKIDSSQLTTPHLIEVLDKNTHIFLTPSQKRIIFVIQKDLPDAIRTSLIASFNNHIERYDRPRNNDTVQIKYYTNQHIPFGQSANTAAFAAPEKGNSLYINTDLTTIRNMYDVSSHEWIHLRKTKKNLIKDKLELVDNTGKIVGINGLVMYINFGEKEDKKFFKIEEAAAEFLAAKINPNREVGDPHYFAVGLAMQEMERRGWIDETKLRASIDNSDIRYLANALYPSIPKNRQLTKLMDLFQGLRDVGNNIHSSSDSDKIPANMLKILDNKDNL